MTSRAWTRLAIAAALAAPGAAGCVPGRDVSVETTAAAQSRVIGTVVDGRTRAPIAATVTFCTFGSTVTDATGSFFFEFDSATPPAVHVAVGAPGYATFEAYVAAPAASTSTAAPLADLGTITLVPGQPLGVVVTLDGNPLAGAQVFAILDQALPAGASETACANEIAATTGLGGAATLENLDPRFRYEVIVPAQNLGPGQDFETARETVTISTQGALIAVNVTSLTAPAPGSVHIVSDGSTDFGPVAFSVGPIVATVPPTLPLGFREAAIGARAGPTGDPQDEAAAFSKALLTDDGSVRLVFDVGVQLVGGASFGFVDDFQAPTAASFGPGGFPLRTITATASAFPGSFDTVWTFTPQAPLPENKVVRLFFFAHSEDPSQALAPPATDPLYRPPAAFRRQGATLTADIDNYNGTTGSIGVGTSLDSTNLYLEFDEVVRGSYQIRGVRDDVNPANPLAGSFLGATPVPFDTTAESVAFNVDTASPATLRGRELGATPGARFRVRLTHPGTGQPFGLGNSGPELTPPQRRTVTILISVRDAAGNTLDAVQELDVK
jgi:hypothetical protein